MTCRNPPGQDWAFRIVPRPAFRFASWPRFSALSHGALFGRVGGFRRAPGSDSEWMRWGLQAHSKRFRYDFAAASRRGGGAECSSARTCAGMRERFGEAKDAKRFRTTCVKRKEEGVWGLGRFSENWGREGAQRGAEGARHGPRGAKSVRSQRAGRGGLGCA